MNSIFRMQWGRVHMFKVGERVVAEGTSKGCVYARGKGVVSPADASAAVEQDRSR